MGMFNYVDWQAELPDGRDPKEAQGGWGWQTKALFENNMDKYIVTPDGQLFKYEYDHHYTGRWFVYGDDMKPIFYDEKPEEDFGFSGPYEETERVNERSTFVPFTGEFNFYGGHVDEWNEYVARFEEGQLVDVHRDDSRDFRIKRNRERGLNGRTSR